MQKMTPQDGQSQDLTQDNIAQLKALFPEILSEKGIDFEVLKQLLGAELVDEEERYSFNWNGKARARRLAQTPTTGTLRPCKEESKNWDTTQNIFIEGDNLEVLKLLQKSYHQKVKMIYIDPPYNTGKDFIYPDDFRDNTKNYLELTRQTDEEGKKLSPNAETSGRYHTNWLNMMYPRLKLARNLLQEDGVIFISIDDEEASNLRKICDDIFGEDNFLAQIMWQKMYSGKADATHFGHFHEYILCYSKNVESANIRLLPRTDAMNARYTNPDDDPRGPWLSNDLTAAGERSAGHYEISSPTGQTFDSPEGKHWLYSQETMTKLLADNRIYFGKNGDAYPRLKRFLTEVQQGRRVNTIWLHNEVGHTDEGTKEVKKYFPSGIEFQAPKPTRLLKQILSISIDPNANELVLDFFAGSGTTADAVMQGNFEFNGNTRFIMVQLPEPIPQSSFSHIANFTKERIRRAGEKIIAQNNDKLSTENIDIGFKAFKLDSSNIKPWDADFDSLSVDLLTADKVIKPERSADDVLFEILLKYGLDLSLPIVQHNLAGKSVFCVAEGALLVCLDDDLSEAVAEAIGQLKTTLAPSVCRVVFKDAGFANDAVKVNAVQVLKQFGIVDVKSL